MCGETTQFLFKQNTAANAMPLLSKIGVSKTKLCNISVLPAGPANFTFEMNQAPTSKRVFANEALSPFGNPPQHLLSHEILRQGELGDGPQL